MGKWFRLHIIENGTRSYVVCVCLYCYFS